VIEHIADPLACLANSPASLEPAAMSFSHVRARFPLTDLAMSHSEDRMCPWRLQKAGGRS
jgi:hypothetical protein